MNDSPNKVKLAISVNLLKNNTLLEADVVFLKILVIQNVDFRLIVAAGPHCNRNFRYHTLLLIVRGRRISELFRQNDVSNVKSEKE